jgi:hypothetical protein
MMRKISRTISGARPRLGSSSISSLGLPISARPMASIWRSPPDMVAAAWLRRSASRGNSAKTSSIVCAWSRWPLRKRWKAPSSRLSSTLISPNRSRFSGTSARPWMTRFSTLAARCVAVEVDVPAGRQQPHDRRQAGRLAGAVGADHGDDLPGAHLEADVVDRLDLAVVHPQVLHLQQRAHSTPPR